MRRLHIGEDVIGPGGVRLGSLDRLVVDETAHAITHLVVSDRVVGVSHFLFEDDMLRCDLGADALAAMPDVHHASIAGAPAHWEAPPGYALENFLRIAGALIGQAAYVPPVEVEPDLVGVHELTEGSPVWFGNHQLGELSLLLTGDGGVVEQLVIHPRGIGEPRLMGVEHVIEVVGNNVHVDVDQQAFEALPRYLERTDPA